MVHASAVPGMILIYHKYVDVWNALIDDSKLLVKERMFSFER